MERIRIIRLRIRSNTCYLDLGLRPGRAGHLGRGCLERVRNVGVWESVKESSKRSMETTRFQYGDKLVQQVILNPREIGQTKKTMQSLEGVHASVETAGSIETRRTMTRNVLLLGKSKKVDNRELYLCITGPDFEWSLEMDPDKGAAGRRFAAKVNTAVKQFDLLNDGEPADAAEVSPGAVTEAPASPNPLDVAPPPPPPPPTSFPPGWYSDPSGAPVLRYFDGQAWTEHTSALPAPPSGN